MEIKYTLEILNKDIQDIGNLVEKLQNSPGGSTLELDLALSKLRNVYDLLSEIRRDMDRKAMKSDPVPAPEPEPAPVPVPEPTPEPETVPEPEPTPEPESVPEPEPKPEPAPEPEPEPKPEPKLKAEIEKKKESEKGTEKEGQILAEQFKAESSINENLAGSRDSEVESKVLGNPIDSISRNIGINDRFLIIRELFEGDSDRFGSMIRELDQAGNLETARDILKKNLEDHGDHQGSEILDHLIQRRYSQN